MPEAVIVHVAGDVDRITVVDLRAAITRALRPDRHLVVDLAGVEYFDASGVHAMEAARDLSARHGRTTVVVAPPGGICRRVIEIAELHHDLPVVDTMDEARAIVRAG